MGYSEVRLIGADGITDDEAAQTATLLHDLVSAGAALGWVEPPSPPEVHRLLESVASGIPSGDAALALATTATGEVTGVGYWRRYDRPTHRVNADLEKLAVSPAAQGEGLGRTLLTTLVAAALHQNIETLTLDLRGDNTRAAALYESAGFTRYGTLNAFVAVGDERYDKLLYSLDLRAAG
ncbi:ribosomal protein S18 acetylase RimI-like enzyme [Actinoplanes lutulentus]|uniref:Acetyltransferase (GNAT) family protein n=1 Tax=Actinoplanes lutulentus TaxID=1287878 RepID=A0A327Z2Q0_9ACTN|nr:GNAT family N-acetyltransferase [Actinoplanes lutulentus]MBB2943688.1 ribosomal protein S18 acetylase RimI-like enzyme [Actinoplanes lutulentus]RAK29233.1 acetyltransferase (GNAT) family protein [Actinoplanes lutulentus]